MIVKGYVVKEFDSKILIDNGNGTGTWYDKTAVLESWQTADGQSVYRFDNAVETRVVKLA